MCGIVGSFNSNTVQVGFEKIKARGTRALSISTITSPGEKPLNMNLSSGPFDKYLKTYLRDSTGFHILHVLSPTGVVGSFHPARRQEHCLWHNGMLNSQRFRTDLTPEWDTQILLDEILDKGLPKALNGFEGSFACVYYDGLEVKIFRNAMSPLFAYKSNVSSVPLTDEYKSIEANTIYKLDVNAEAFIICQIFENSHNPYGL